MTFSCGVRMAVLIGTAILLPACSDSSMGVDDNGGGPPLALNQAVTTDDSADRIQLTSSPDPTAGGMLNVCLEIRTSAGWWKGLGVGRMQPTVEGEGQGKIVCAQAEPGNLTFNFWKAKLFGVHTHVGARSFDLSAYAGHKIVFEWQQE